MYLLGKLEKTKKKHIHYHRQYRKYFETEWRMDVITINVNNKPIISCVASISCISLVYINENPEFEKKFVIASIRSFFPPLFFPPRITANQQRFLISLVFNTACSRGSSTGGKKGKPIAIACLRKVFAQRMPSHVINFQPTPRYSRVIRHDLIRYIDVHRQEIHSRMSIDRRIAKHCDGGRKIVFAFLFFATLHFLDDSSWKVVLLKSRGSKKKTFST